VVGEYLGSARGVGYLILQAEGTFDVNTVFAGIVVLTGFALVLDGLVGVVERRLMTWQPALTTVRRVTISGARLSWPLSATWPVTSSCLHAARTRSAPSRP
jgi:hypothetical protein